jgi:hypothetical protein
MAKDVPIAFCGTNSEGHCIGLVPTVLHLGDLIELLIDSKIAGAFVGLIAGVALDKDG